MLLSILTKLNVNASESVITDTANSLSSNKISERYADEFSGRICFEIETTEAGNYNLSFWQCAARKTDGTFQSYALSVNGQDYKTPVSPQESGWCALAYPNEIYLKKGHNKISFNSNLPCIPNIEFVEISKSGYIRKAKMMLSSAYRDYVSSIKSTPRKIIEIGGGIGYNDTSYTASDHIGCKIPYDFNYEKIDWFGYSFYTTAYFKAGETITCSSQGINNVKHFLEIFSADAPERYSWTSLSDDNGNNTLTISIQYTGTYYIKARTFKNGSKGLCNINVNNLMSYESVPICSMGFKISFNATEAAVYNFFTANCQSDPFMFLVQGGTTNGKVYSYNNDYASSGDFNWGKNARIAKKLTKNTKLSSINISSTGSYNPIGRCEVYAGCKNSPITPFFENLKQDDAIASAPADGKYNCISWSGGITSYWEWPCHPASAYYAGNDDLASFDLFYSSERYPGCTQYVRSPLSNANRVDLWGFKQNGEVEFTHGSITGDSDGNYHGYDWESKPGALTRTFHPRNALNGAAYGKVLYHYNISKKNPDKTYSLEESIADNKAVMENVKLSEYQESYISNNIAKINANDVTEFNNLYSAWESIWNNTIFSNPDVIKDTEEYESLIAECTSNKNLIYLVYDKINKGVQSVIPLFEDLVLIGNESNRQKMNRIHLSNSNRQYDEGGRKIVRSISSNLKLLLKELVADANSNKKHSSVEDLYDAEDEINISSETLLITVNLNLSRNSAVAIDIIDLDGNTLERIIDSQDLERGCYDYSVYAPKNGVYLVRCNINGHIDVKKIYVK